MGHDERELAEIRTRLYALPPDEFVAARNAEAKQATGRLARTIKGLRRPTLSAWLVNLLAAHRGDELHQLLVIGDQLRDAQRDLKGHELRELSTRRQAVTTALIAQVRELAAEHGRTVRDDAIWEAETTLRAALADPDLAEQVRTGTLVKPADYNGLGLLPTGPAADGTGGNNTRNTAGETVPDTDGAAPGRRGRAKLRVILGGRSGESKRTEGRTQAAPADTRQARERKAAAARAEAEKALAEAERHLEEATVSEDAASRRIGEIAAAFDELRERERRLRAEQTEADRDRRRAHRRRTAAQKALADARRRLKPR